ncbi:MULTISPECIES: DUF6990 domain-containing protein [unclassified Halomonas]|uniref:DUF6990 domain-containing protein n=1 Tax=unclassified Halomonas TaxID=2609666 RepID=UPI001C947EDD|nr:MULTISPECIES: hypothetical protein [unclassified Halomonas]MBY5927466.1 hypothetical protein [Halomonas sp. DP4Y7-2]MBY6234506.1 hypothetical protein [Halomonas sp. DP4Y7-1]
MKLKEVTDMLGSIGWSIYTDEVGDRSACYRCNDRTVQIIYGIEKIRDKQKFGAMLSLATDSFSNACVAIDPGYGDDVPFIRAWSGLDIRAPEILEEHVRQASEEAISWAKVQDLDKALQDHAALPTNAPGARPIWHLAALALLGDVVKLRFYQDSFADGNRLGFVNYVTKDYIDRAVELAEKNAVRH